MIDDPDLLGTVLNIAHIFSLLLLLFGAYLLKLKPVLVRAHTDDAIAKTRGQS